MSRIVPELWQWGEIFPCVSNMMSCLWYLHLTKKKCSYCSWGWGTENAFIQRWKPVRSQVPTVDLVENILSWKSSIFQPVLLSMFFPILSYIFLLLLVTVQFLWLIPSLTTVPLFAGRMPDESRKSIFLQPLQELHFHILSCELLTHWCLNRERFEAVIEYLTYSWLSVFCQWKSAVLHDF